MLRHQPRFHRGGRQGGPAELTALGASPPSNAANASSPISAPIVFVGCLTLRSNHLTRKSGGRRAVGAGGRPVNDRARGVAVPATRNRRGQRLPFHESCSSNTSAVGGLAEAATGPHVPPARIRVNLNNARGNSRRFLWRGARTVVDARTRKPRCEVSGLRLRVGNSQPR